jgi:hypothetical protein
MPAAPHSSSSNVYLEMLNKRPALLINAVANNFAKKKYCFNFKNIDFGTGGFVVSASEIDCE